MITKKEHDRRIRLTEKVLGPIGDKVDGIILVGSMAYGTIDSLRPDSDVDVICVRSFKRVQELAEVKDLEAGLSDEMVQVTSEGK
ncbi:MAG: hypothetical protein KJ574_00970 [Nanoarchaeota archaeon]|nr:hypothetical protein [Nanoarchaeota archaeon]